MSDLNKDFNSAISFIVEIDGLKNIFRQTKVIGNKRFENDAEHSWHICVMAYILRDFFEDDKIDVSRAIKMLLIHDVVELYVGDTYCYDVGAQVGKYDREYESACKIFGMLPENLKNECMSLWLEFDKEETNDAIFASAMDKIQPLILNYHNEGKAWLANGISRSQVESRMGIALEKGPLVLKNYVKSIIDGAVEKGYLKPE